MGERWRFCKRTAFTRPESAMQPGSVNDIARAASRLLPAEEPASAPQISAAVAADINRRKHDIGSRLLCVTVGDDDMLVCKILQCTWLFSISLAFAKSQISSDFMPWHVHQNLPTNPTGNLCLFLHLRPIPVQQLKEGAQVNETVGSSEAAPQCNGVVCMMTALRLLLADLRL
jgi:hypothetical protein